MDDIIVPFHWKILARHFGGYMGRSLGPFAKRIPIALVFVFVFVMASSANTLPVLSTIQGTVYDKQRNPLVDVEVELLDEFYRTWRVGGRTRTDGSGTYHFNNLPDGRYTVKVYAFRYDLEDQEAPVEIQTQNIRGGEGTSYVPQDFYLSPKRGGLAEAEASVVFAQDVPDAAKKFYDQALTDLKAGRRNEGILALSAAVNAFPNYFNALSRAGRELYIIKRYQEAIPFLIKAIEVNEKSAVSLYYLGASLHGMGKEFNKAARTSLRQSLVMAPNSPQVLLSLGIVERAMGNFKESETELIKAKKLSRVPNPEIHKELSMLYGNDLKRYKDAADELELYLKASGMSGEQAKGVKKNIADLRAKASSAPKS